MQLLAVCRRETRSRMTPEDRSYQEKVEAVSMINSEYEFVGLVRELVDFGNKWIMKSGTVEVYFRDEGGMTQ